MPATGCLVILNPTADRGEAGRREPELRAALEEAGLAFELVRTEAPGHASELAREAVRAGVALVVAAGGDGTVNEVAQGLVGTEVPLGILPIGSGNDYVRALGIPRDLRAAARRLKSQPPRRVDVGLVEGRYYVSSLGMGIDGQIARDFRQMRFLKGEAGFLAAALLEIVRFRSFRAEVEADGWKFSGWLLSTAAMNGPYAGGGFYLAPQARPDDGQLDLVFIGNYPRVVRFAVLPKTRDGSYLSLCRMQHRRAQKARIEADRPLPVHMDGELLPEPISSLAVELRSQALLVI
ncbi:diacylglycerol kinase family lipid kinase [Candidatus Bipolaricaulota bacterium]|nr:diacylglycerol kinase family lipid kinase [Candidatus Bipolaricaulota bacterium]